MSEEGQPIIDIVFELTVLDFLAVEKFFISQGGNPFKKKALKKWLILMSLSCGFFGAFCIYVFTSISVSFWLLGFGLALVIWLIAQQGTIGVTIYWQLYKGVFESQLQMRLADSMEENVIPVNVKLTDSYLEVNKVGVMNRYDFNRVIAVKQLSGYMVIELKGYQVVPIPLSYLRKDERVILENVLG